MKTSDLLIRCIALRENGQWVAICLPFDLAAQGATVDEVKVKMREQINNYLQDALVGQDRKHAADLLNRRAPLKYWALYWVASAVGRLRKHADLIRFRTPVPLAPVAC